MASTINTLTFENESGDDEFNIEEAKKEQVSLDSNDSESSESYDNKLQPTEETLELTETIEKLDLDQIPLGTDKVLMNRRNMKQEGEILVFNNAEQELQEISVETRCINELDSEDLDGDEEKDPDFDEKLAIVEMSEQAEKEDGDCEDSSRESVENEMDGVEQKESGDGCKLVFDDVEKYRAEQKIKEDNTEDDCEGQGGMGTEYLVTGNMEEYDETNDADFNPVYCNDTLSDVESEEEPETEENEETPEVIQLKSNACMFKIENMKIPPMEPNFEDDTNEEETGEMEDWNCPRAKSIDFLSNIFAFVLISTWTNPSRI